MSVASEIFWIFGDKSAFFEEKIFFLTLYSVKYAEYMVYAAKQQKILVHFAHHDSSFFICKGGGELNRGVGKWISMLWIVV